MRGDDRVPQPSSAETLEVAVNGKTGTFEFVKGATLEETRDSLTKFMEELFRSQCGHVPTCAVVPPAGHPLLLPSSAVVTVPPMSYTVGEFSVDLHAMWWESVRADFAELLPDEEATIVLLGGNFCPNLHIVRSGRSTFELHVGGKKTADITGLVGGVERTTMVSRARWLADHLGCAYSRQKRQQTYRKMTRRERLQRGR